MPSSLGEEISLSKEVVANGFEEDRFQYIKMW